MKAAAAMEDSTGLAAERFGNRQKAVLYYQQLAAGAGNSERPEIKAARSYLAGHRSNKFIRFSKYGSPLNGSLTTR